MDFSLVIVISLVLFIIYILSLLFINLIGQAFKGYDEAYTVPIIVATIVCYLFFVNVDVTVNKKIKPTEFVKTENGVVVSYKETTKYIRDINVVKHYSDSTKVKYYYNQDYLAFGVYLRDYISYEIKY